MNVDKITEISLIKTNEIMSSMESHSFHNHFHILYDICNEFKQDITYLEIGCFAGGSASLVSSHHLVKNSYSIDLGFPISNNIPIKNVNKYKNKNCNYNYIEGDSKSIEIVNYVHTIIDTVDILYIDGDHSYNGVINDFKNYEKLVKNNGYLIFDDYHDYKFSPEVKSAVDFIVDNYSENKYEIIGSLSYDLIKKTNLPEFKFSNLFIFKKIVKQ